MEIKLPLFVYDGDGTPKFILVKCDGKLRVFERLEID